MTSREENGGIMIGDSMASGEAMEQAAEDSGLTEGLERVNGGWIIARTDEYVIDVTRQIFNWRLHVALPENYGQVYEHGFCYFGTGADSLVLAIEAGKRWEDPLNTDPIGFGKKAF